MTDLEKLKNAYVEKFGGYPHFLLRGASDEYVAEQLKKALDSGQEITADDPDADY
jgi:hypothetical protein